MSDAPQGPEWWQAVDGKWYPPERHPDHQPPEHVADAGVSAHDAPPGGGLGPDGPSVGRNRPWYLRLPVLALVGASLFTSGLLTGYLISGGEDEVRTTAASGSSTGPEATSDETQEPTTTTTTTTVPTADLAGSIAYLESIGFGGNVDGRPSEPPPPGTQCSGQGAYSDLVPGAAVTVSDGTGRILATVPLGSGATVDLVRATTLERSERRRLIDSIFELRASEASANGLSVEAAQARLDGAEQRLYDLEHPDDLAFEGLPFQARWCRMPFGVTGLPVLPSYTITVAQRNAAVYTTEQLATTNNWIDLFAE